MLDFGRDICNNLQTAASREWLVTNGIGGYASGTIAGILTSRYHGLLIAALQPPVGRTLLVTKLDETAVYNGNTYPLFANRRGRSNRIQPHGFYNIERFRLEGTTPVWTFACADARLEKRIWMEPGANTTYIRYDFLRGSSPLALALQPLVNARDHHLNTHTPAWEPILNSLPRGFSVQLTPEFPPVYLFTDRAEAHLQRSWLHDFYLPLEQARGLDAYDNHLTAGLFHAVIRPGESLTVVASTDPNPRLDGWAACTVRQNYEQRLITESGLEKAPAPIRQLILAADQFIVRRDIPNEPDGRTIIAGYPWFADWGRDTMISLPGLTLTTRRYEIARSILRTFARFVDQGMLPNNFPEIGQQPGYNTVDATLWYFEALRAYLEETDDLLLIQELYPILEDIITWHRKGTRYQIHVDPADGLLYAGEPGVQLTWMDVKIDDWVVTPRTGKPIEINALWYNALHTMADFAQRLNLPAQDYLTAAEQVRTSFERFWNPNQGYCYDVIDGPDGDDPTLRPNQIFAVSLPASPLPRYRQQAVVDACARYLLTSHGLRSLAPNDLNYIGHFGGDRVARDSAYHQGTTWGWLIGPFVLAHYRVYQDPARARSYLEPLFHHLQGHAVGTLSEIFDGDAPFTPCGCLAQAWTVAEVLRAWEAVTLTK